MSDRLYLRKAVVTVDSVQVECNATGLRCGFEIEKDLGAKPNTCKLQVYNLNPDHRQSILTKASKKVGGKPQGVLVRVEAGYEDTGTTRIFDGDLRWAFVTRDGPDIVLHVESGTGEVIHRTGRINKSWGPGTPVSQVIKDVGLALGLGNGNLTAQIEGVALDGWGSSFTQGTVASGSTVKELTRLTKSAGLTWSIQDGTLQILGNGKSLDGTAVLVDGEHGMIGSPSIDQKGTVSVKIQIVPNVYPGRKLQLNALDLQGLFVVQKAKYQGDMYTDDWYIDVEAKRLS